MKYSKFAIVLGLAVAARADISTNQLNVLAIGNSFSICVLNNLPQMVATFPHTNMRMTAAMIGGCTLQRHWSNVVASTNADFRPYAMVTRVVEDGKQRILPREPMNLPEILKAAEWNVITIQQGSHESWDYSFYQPYADNLIDYVRKMCPDAKIMIQQTWGYRADAPRLTQWNMSPKQMHRLVTGAYRELEAHTGLEVIPVGRAIKLFRDMWSIDPFVPATAEQKAKLVEPALPKQQNDVVGAYRWNGSKEERKIGADTIHLNARGEYLQALVWFLVLYGDHLDETNYRGNGIDVEGAIIMKSIARAAVKPGFTLLTDCDSEYVSDSQSDGIQASAKVNNKNVVNVRKLPMESAPTADLDSWIANATKAGSFYSGVTPANCQTEAYVAVDTDTLYVGVRAYGENYREPENAPSHDHDWEIFGSDKNSIELFVDPDDSGLYYQFALASTGVAEYGPGHDSAWDPEWTGVCTNRPDKAAVDYFFAIPMNIFASGLISSKWPIAIGRNDGTAKESSANFSWKEGGFHNWSEWSHAWLPEDSVENYRFGVTSVSRYARVSPGSSVSRYVVCIENQSPVERICEVGLLDDAGEELVPFRKYEFREGSNSAQIMFEREGAALRSISVVIRDGDKILQNKSIRPSVVFEK